MIFEKKRGERKMYVDMGKMQGSDVSNPLSLPVKGQKRRRTKTKGRKIYYSFARMGDKAC